MPLMPSSPRRPPASGRPAACTPVTLLRQLPGLPHQTPPGFPIIPWRRWIKGREKINFRLKPAAWGILHSLTLQLPQARGPSSGATPSVPPPGAPPSGGIGRPVAQQLSPGAAPGVGTQRQARWTQAGGSLVGKLGLKGQRRAVDRSQACGHRREQGGGEAEGAGNGDPAT